MVKARKPNSTKKPPVPSPNGKVIDDWIEGVMPKMNPLVKYLDQQIRDLHPELQYAIKWKNAYYGLPDQGWIIEMAAYEISVNIVFLGGADFKSPPPLGDTDRSRYIKLKSLEEAKAPEVRQWIEQAGRVPGWK